MKLSQLKQASNLDQEWQNRDAVFRALLTHGEFTAAALLYTTVQADWQGPPFSQFDTTTKLYLWKKAFNDAVSLVNKQIGLALYNNIA